MTKNTRPNSRSRAPTWIDWLLPAIASVAAVVLLTACFWWWSAQSSKDQARTAGQARLDSIGRAVVAFCENEAVGPNEVDTLLMTFGPRDGLVTAERVEAETNPLHSNPDIVFTTMLLPRDLGFVHLVDVIEPARSSAKSAPILIAGALAAMVLCVTLAATRRTSGLRRVGSALRAVVSGEKDHGVLLVADRFGPDALAWNKLLSSLKEYEQKPTDSIPNRRDSSAQAGVLPGGALDAMPFGLIALDQECSVVFCNGAAAVMLGVNRVELIGKTIDQDEAFAELAGAIRTVAGGDTPRTTLDLSRGEGARRDVFRVTVRALRKDDEANVLIIIDDVTQIRLADEARNGFVAQATHELRTPLTNIRLLIEEAIEGGVSESPELANTLNIVNHEARRLDRVVTDMLSVSEIEAATLTLHIDDTPLGKLFNDLEMDYRAQADEKTIDLKFTLPAKLETIRADREKLSLLLHNVLGNAIKYTPENGQVELSAEQDESELTVRIKDNGPGIAPEDHEKVFHKFYRTDSARASEATGSGLGLALAREIARLHGGDIELESELGRGSLFTVRIPLGVSGSIKQAA